MFAQSSTSATTRNFLLRGAAEGNCNVDKIGTTPTGICASFPTFHDMMRMDIDDADLFLPSQKSLSSNNRSASASNVTVDDNLIDELAFLQESFQAADTCGEMVDDEGFFELSVSEDDSFSEKTLTPARFSTSKMTCSSIHNTKASSISTICTKSSSTVEQIRSLEAKLTKSMQRTNMSRTVIQDDMSSRPHHLSRSSFVSHASTASLSSVGTMSSASSIPLPCPHNTSNISPKRIASTAAFLMGKRSTITPALEESRKKLKMYMEQLDMSV
jgi:hypothetical protein